MLMKNTEAAELLADLDLGSGVAETDNLLEAARIETSVFDDLIADRVDLIPGTKGSGKTALYRILVDFLPDTLLRHRRVVLAHGVSTRQDTVFLAFKEQFDKLDESDFVDFWCVYLASLANEQFIRNLTFDGYLHDCSTQVERFRIAYRNANIPELDRPRTLKEIISWSLAVVKKLKPKVVWKAPEDIGQFELQFGETEATPTRRQQSEPKLPLLINELVDALGAVLDASDLSIWLMIDRLDELFARRSATERKALRALLTTTRLFSSERIRVKIFLRDDILEQIVAGDGFTALSHVASRRSDTLRWTEDQLLSMVVRRIFANPRFRKAFRPDEKRLLHSIEYQKQIFYQIFEDTVYRPPNQSPTMRWIYNHIKDGRGVVTPRDVINLVARAGQWQRDEYRRTPDTETARLISGKAVLYGLSELSKEKKTLYLEAEFPHKWKLISKFVGGGSEYSERALRRIMGAKWQEVADDLVSMGVLERASRKGARTFKIPFVYRAGLECTQKFVAT